jgi:predicted aspartyl protease
MRYRIEAWAFMQTQQIERQRISMIQLQTANLPRDQRQRLHPDFLANEQAYTKMRDSLLPQYRGQWVAVGGGKVLAAGTNLLELMEKASTCGGHPFFALVGAEDSVVFRARRAVFAYDQGYQPFPLPRLSATFWNHSETHSQQHADVIPDTGADVSLLPDADCKAIDLFNSPCLLGTAGGAVGPSVTTLFYQGKIEIDARRYSALIQAIPAGRERILGRDVLNQQRLLFDGPARQVVVNP